MPALNTSILGQEVPIANVAKALRELWADESVKTRASLINFAIYSENPASLERNTVLLDSLTREHSCRSLLILNVPGESKPQTSAWITAHCQLHGNNRSVCCEQLSFVIEGGTADQVRNTIFSNLDSDLPLVVWWQGELTDRLDERFAAVIDSLIIDSSQFAEPAKSLRRVLEMRSLDTSSFVLSDLAWMRSHFLRTSLATACQSPKVLANLGNVNRLAIKHAPGHRMSAQMLAAWIGTQLKCSALSPNELQITGDGKISIEYSEGAEGCPLQSLEMSGNGLSIAIKRDPCSAFAHTTQSSTDLERDVVMPADFSDDADLIGEQLSRLGGLTRYFEIMPLLQAML
jgi:glucose-6-phosphate dehydrogenase assembly protein OpcA